MRASAPPRLSVGRRLSGDIPARLRSGIGMDPPPRGGDRMNDDPKQQVSRLDDIERRGRSIPVREHFGIHGFGANAYTPTEDGTLISEHDESGSGQEELYIVLDGNATFEVDGETIDAPAGTFVSVQ